ncbi:MAG: HEPN domain-containing protein [Pseudomonadota bacterium]
MIYIQGKIDKFIDQCFRDMADLDYIAARECYRRELFIQYLWLAQQSVEKYLKGILLYSRRNTKCYSHNLQKLMKNISKIDGLEFLLTEEVEKYIEYLDRQGMNRYFEKEHFMEGDDILYLDRTVWQIRRYCRQLRPELVRNGDVLISPIDGVQVEKLNRALKNDDRFSVPIRGGLLEKIVKGKHSGKRESLVWHNFCFGKKRKNTIRNHRSVNRFSDPIHLNDSELKKELQKIVKL